MKIILDLIIISGQEVIINMDRIRIGVIGLGWFGEHHIDTLQQLPLAEVAAVCTRRRGPLKEIAGKYKIQKSYTDYHDSSCR